MYFDAFEKVLPFFKMNKTEHAVHSYAAGIGWINSNAKNAQQCPAMFSNAKNAQQC